MSKLLEIKDLVTNFYTYEGVVKALNHINLEIERGVTFGLVGESGCGKSVTVRTIMGIVQPPGYIEGGEIIFHIETDGKTESVDLLQQSEKYMQGLRGNQISMIFQEPNAALNPVLSAGEQIAESYLFHQKPEMCRQVLKDFQSPEDRTLFFLKPLLKNIYQLMSQSPNSVFLKILSRIPLLKYWDFKLRKEAIKRSTEILRSLSIPNPEEVIKAYPHQLSGGMKQRIVIAIALACHPILLIADEATSNLDVTIQAQILELLLDLKKEVISSILLITHDLGIVAETCDRAGVMYAGNVCEVADVKDLFKHPKHPYTVALLNSVPKFTQEGKLESIPGSVPNLVTPPTGCRFHPRCAHVMEICSQQQPEMKQVDHRHSVACHLFNQDTDLSTE